MNWLFPKSTNNEKRKATKPPEKVEESPKKEKTRTFTAVKSPLAILSNIIDYNVVNEKLEIWNFLTQGKYDA